MNMYVDGILQQPNENNSYSGNITNSGGVRDTRIGVGSIGGGTQYFNGLIDEVQIYDSALTAKKIKEIYAEGAKKFNLAIK
jgi:hypothetical protein